MTHFSFLADNRKAIVNRSFISIVLTLLWTLGNSSHARISSPPPHKPSAQNTHACLLLFTEPSFVSFTEAKKSHDRFYKTWGSSPKEEKLTFVKNIANALSNYDQPLEVRNELYEIVTDIRWAAKVEATYFSRIILEEEFSKIYIFKNFQKNFEITMKDLAGVTAKNNKDYLGILRRYRETMRLGGTWSPTPTDWELYEDDLMRNYLTSSLLERPTFKGEQNVYGFLKTAEKRGEPYIDLLLKGASLNQGRTVHTVSEMLEHPSPRDISRAFQNFLNSTGIPPEDSIRPGRAVLLKDQRTIQFITFDDPIPEGAKLAGYLEDGDFFRGLAEGIMVLGSPYDLNWVSAKAHTFFEHDLGHLAGFMASPTYMRAVRRNVKKLYSAYLRNSETTGFNWEDFKFYKASNENLGIALEEMAVFKPEFKKEANSFLPDTPPGLKENALKLFFLNRINSRPLSETIRYFESLSARYRKWILPLGGAQADLFTIDSFSAYTQTSQLTGPYFRALSFLEACQHGRESYCADFVQEVVNIQIDMTNELRSPKNIEKIVEHLLSIKP